ncbi:hypothetical protein [Actinosynnema sp. NPDC020468]|uniref:hypothetical protein n=1 Tax=Actinosynnema sp. NPDC020468 TaxID=3154488 RepID=UPI0033F8F08B
MHEFDDHPDIKDEKWIRAANRRARKEIRASRRRARLRARGGVVVSLVALLAIGGLGYGLYRQGVFGDLALSEALPDVRGFDRDHPFVGTPAENWADGAAGVVAPVAEPLGDFGAEEVAAAYELARNAVVTTRLDRRVVQDHDVEPVLALYAPAIRDEVRGYFDGGHDREAGGYATRVAAGQRLLPVEPKAKGAMSVVLGSSGDLQVHTSYVFAYAFDTDRPVTDPMQVVVVSRVDSIYAVRGGDGVWSGRSGGYTYSMACKAAEQGFLAPWITETKVDLDPSAAAEPREAYFDPAHSLQIGDSCTS